MEEKSGFAQVGLVLLLVLGVGVGALLVQQKTGLVPKADELVCDGTTLNKDVVFSENKDKACDPVNEELAIKAIMSRDGSPCKTEEQAQTALKEACSDVPPDVPPADIPAPTNTTASSNINSPTGSNCTCSAIANAPEFQGKQDAACGSPGAAAGLIASQSNGNCTVSQAAAELAKICNNTCPGSASQQSAASTTNVPLFKIGNEPTQSSTGDGTGASKCTCQAIAANPEFQQKSGLACQFKNEAVNKIVEGSAGNCDSATAASELDKICEGKCNDSMGQAIAPGNSGGGGFLGSFLNTIKSIPFIGSLVEQFGGGNGSGSTGQREGGIGIPIIGNFLSGGSDGDEEEEEDDEEEEDGNGGEDEEEEENDDGNGGGFNFGETIKEAVGAVKGIAGTIGGFLGGLF